jgi:hypothetical protein
MVQALSVAVKTTGRFWPGLSYCQNVNYVTWSRDHEARLANLTLEQPLTSRQQLTTNFNTAYVPLQVIFVHVDRASIPTLIFEESPSTTAKSVKVAVLVQMHCRHMRTSASQFLSSVELIVVYVVCMPSHPSIPKGLQYLTVSAVTLLWHGLP